MSIRETAQLRVLILDHYDSFTYNIVNLIAKCNDNIVPYIVANNACTYTDIQHLINCHNINCIIIGPGPGHVNDSATLGVTSDVLRNITDVPILGICLGLQALVHIRGGHVVHTQPMHGQLCTITHNAQSPLYAGAPRQFQTIRYNSLTGDRDSIPESLTVVAVCRDDNTVQAVEDSTGLPIYGVQYHPESVCSQYGETLMRNFISIAKQYNSTQQRTQQWCNKHCAAHWKADYRNTTLLRSAAQRVPAVSRTLRLQHKRVNINIDPERVYTYLYADKQSDLTSYWLDSSKSDGTRQTRFSYISDTTGEHAYVVTYQLHNKTAAVLQNGQCVQQWQSDDIFDDIESITVQYQHTALLGALPFDYQCGFASYISYEMHQTTLPASHIHQQTHKQHTSDEQQHLMSNQYPDALFIFSDRLLVYDNDELCWYAVALVDTASSAANEQWLNSVEGLLHNAQQHMYTHPVLTKAHPNLQSQWRFNEAQYKQLINDGLQQLRDGNSYELCLTNHTSLTQRIDPLALYINLRTINPAPYAAFFNIDLSALPGTTVNKLGICSSSPERFVQVTRNSAGELVCECKPIKGTIARGRSVQSDKANIQQLQSSAKDYAENLMIVDLIRNDLSHVCELSSIAVPKLMHIETYATVHQLVSTITGKLSASNTAVDCIKALFPPGSMTGAPKISSVDILGTLEQQPRGIYSGCIGYISLNGTCDTSVVIRTIVCTNDQHISIGAGGAITHQSNVNAEYSEVLLKAQAPLRALQMTVNAA